MDESPTIIYIKVGENILNYLPNNPELGDKIIFITIDESLVVIDQAVS